ncbi:nuclease-related domain-containing protein [Planococcus sp. APC 3906]|uniref:nuclease-related domain-containing protein n=1 Tax=Planococcus sp. APC 3906 TaxID=3035194 RepID=UPI0025B4C590|nr:nuclease-related domain-containing protein [Planococcus sp. APC 3906]MDN3449188.1 nuclease-related domain-containing protein [Planococcus sp. APC 3906]
MDDRLLAQLILAERLPKNHAAWQPLAADLKNLLAGAGGESRTVELLKRELELDEAPVLLVDVHVTYQGGFAQIDVLVVHAAFVCVLEVKNMRGEFFFDAENFQFHRMVDGRLEGMRNPESQLHRAVKAIRKFLEVPVEGVIVLASRSARVVEKPAAYPVVALHYLPFYLEGLDKGGKLFDVEELSRKLGALPKRVFRGNVMAQYGLTAESLRLGVTCPDCRSRSLGRKNRKWHCAGCDGVFIDAHEVALQEYAVLFGEELATQFAYRLLGVEDKYLLYRLLEKSALQGDKRGKRWIVPRRELLMEYFGAIYK